LQVIYLCKCLFYNLFDPRLGAYPSHFVPTWPVRTERGGYLLTYCCLILQARRNSTVKVSRVGGAQVIQVSAYCKIVVSSPSWGLPFSLCSNLASLEPSEEVIYSHIVVLFCRPGTSHGEKCPGWRSGHSGKCKLIYCCFFPVLGLTLLTLFKPGQFGAERGGYLLTYCCLILQARRTVGMTNCGWRYLGMVVVISCGKSIVLPLILIHTTHSLTPRFAPSTFILQVMD
jgi:hypothetical protein